MLQAPQTIARAITLCPVCGAAAGPSAGICRHCGFCSQPEGAPVPQAQANDHLRDLGLQGGEAQILVLTAGDAGLAVSGQFDVVLTGDALDRAGDVNRLMADIGKCLRPRGLMVAELSGWRFGKNSLQILLERHGFRIAPRPLKWRLSSWSRRRILARKL